MNAPEEPPPRARGGEGLKMRELVRAAGVPKSTILFYLGAGLLPPPIRRGPNSARYDPECVARIALIRRLQRKERLTLAEIAARLRGEGPGAGPTAPLRGSQPARAAPTRRERILDREAFSHATGLARARLERLVRRGVLVPGPDGFAANDVAAGRAIAALLADGLDEEDLAAYGEAAERLSVWEERLLRRGGWGRGEERSSAAERLTALRRHLFIDRLDRLAARKAAAAPARLFGADPEPWLD